MNEVGKEKKMRCNEVKLNQEKEDDQKKKEKENCVGGEIGDKERKIEGSKRKRQKEIMEKKIRKIKRGSRRKSN